MRTFNKFENANAILNGMEDCADEFVNGFVELHQQPLNNEYMYEWLLRSILDSIKINHSVLYVACGTAGYRRLFHNIKRFVGIDFSRKMIAAACAIKSNPDIDTDFKCTTFESYQPAELFDIVYLGPYGHNVPYTYEALYKAKAIIKDDGMIFCTCPDPQLNSKISRIKEFIKNLIVNKNFDYDPIQKLEKMLKKTDLEVYLKLKMKTSIGYAHCYVVKK